MGRECCEGIAPQMTCWIQKSDLGNLDVSHQYMRTWIHECTLKSSNRLKLLAKPFGTKINTSSNISIVLVYLCDVRNGLADNFNPVRWLSVHSCIQVLTCTGNVKRKETQIVPEI